MTLASATEEGSCPSEQLSHYPEMAGMGAANQRGSQVGLIESTVLDKSLAKLDHTGRWDSSTQQSIESMLWLWPEIRPELCLEEQRDLCPNAA